MNSSRMRIAQVFYLSLIVALLFSSCAIEVEQAIATPTMENTPVTAATSVFPVTQIPVTWAHLNLTGRLVYITSRSENDLLSNTIQRLNLGTGELEAIFTTPPGAWIYYGTVSPDGKWIVISYTPPAQPNAPSSRSLYILPLDASGELKTLLIPPTSDDHFTQAEWSPEGNYIYYVHYNSKIRHEGQLDPVFNIFRTTYPDVKPEKIFGDSFWTRLSSDSSQMVYVYVNPASSKNELFVANADGSNAQPIALTGAFLPDIIDAPIFSPDGTSILFSAPEPTQSYLPNFFERVMGIQVAKAHSVPSDWWSVPVTGGVPTRLTNLQTINLFASISPDQQHVASLSGDGIFVMDLDGSNLTQLVSDSGVHGTVRWIP